MLEPSQLLLQLNLHDIAGADGSRADALLVGLQEFKAPLVYALDLLARPEKRRADDSALQPRQNDVAQWLLEEVEVIYILHLL